MPVAVAADEEDRANSIYRVARAIKRKENSLYNALRSIYEDSIFVAEIAGLWPELPLVANLRCGLWYSPRFEATCYFKSTDGHANNWSFSTLRLNLHLAFLAGQRGGCIVVDSTRKGKRFPDSMSKTIPIWTCVLNRAIERQLRKVLGQTLGDGEADSSIAVDKVVEARHLSADWDCSLHLPLWVSDTERAAIEDHVEEWTRNLESCGADICSLASIITKPLRPLWISQKTVIWLNEVPKYDSWDFTPIILVSASLPHTMIQQRTTSEFSWNYIPGAGDDEESWARGLHPNLFWKHAYDLIDSGPSICNQKVSELVENERVYRAHRNDFLPQVPVKPQKQSNDSTITCVETKLLFSYMTDKSSNEEQALYWIGSTSLAVGRTVDVMNSFGNEGCILNCDPKFISSHPTQDDSYLHLPIVCSKLDRFSLRNSLCPATNFARLNLKRGKKLVICCHNGEDISICTSLAILTALFSEEGTFDDGMSYMSTSITKWDLRRRLVFICKYAVNARPSRGNLKQVFGFLSMDQEHFRNTEPCASVSVVKKGTKNEG